MKRLLLACLILSPATPAGAADRHYSVTDFDRVQIDGPYAVTLSTGGPSSATAIGSQAAIDRVAVEVQGRTLRIRPNRSAWGGYPGQRIEPVRIELSTRELRAAVVVGSANLAIDKARGLRLDLSLSGSGSLGVARIEADNLFVGLLGSGKIMLAGKAKQLRAGIQGSGDLDAAALTADDIIIDANTAGSVIMGATRSAKIKALGAGDVEITGTPSCTVEALGAGIVRCGR